MRRCLALLIAFFSSAALAQHGGGGLDPNFLNESGFVFNSTAGTIPSRDVGGKTLGTQTINTGVQNCILIAVGQSNIENIAPSSFTPVNPNSLDNLNIYDSAIYKAADALVGPSSVGGSTTAGHPILRLADAYVSGGNCSRVIIVPIAIGGTTVADWNTGIFNQRLSVTMRRISQRLQATGPTLKCGSTNIACAVLWGQGEQDNFNGTAQATYTAALNNVIATSNSTATALGWGGSWATWFVARQTFYTGAASATIQAAQAAVITGVQVFAGANADNLIGNVCGAASNSACRQGDNTHWTDAGSLSYANDAAATNGWKTKMHASGVAPW